MRKSSINGMEKFMLASGAIGSISFVTVFIILGRQMPLGFEQKFTVSALVSGDLGYLQQLNFLGSGLLFLLFAKGLKRTVAPVRRLNFTAVLFALAGVGLLGAGVFRAQLPGETGLHAGAILHYAFALLLFLSLPLACYFLLPVFRASLEIILYYYSLCSLFIVLVFFVLMIAGIAGLEPFSSYKGVLQRISIGAGFAWVAVLSLFLLSRRSAGRG